MTTDAYPSARNLTEGFGRGPGTPLRDFQGTLNSIVQETVTPDQGKPFQQAHFNFTDLTVFASVEPYPHPVATIKMKVTGSKNSPWGIFSATLCDLMTEGEDLGDQIGGVHRWVWIEGRDAEGKVAKGHDLGFKDKNWKPAEDEEGKVVQSESDRPNVVSDAWEVMELNGAVRGQQAVSAKDRAIALLDGQTKAQFNKATMTDTLIKGDDEFRATILDGKFIASVLDSGEFILGEDQVYHKTGLVAEVEESISQS